MTTFAPGSTGTDEVLFARSGRIGRIRLNRPRAINSLTLPMVTAISEQLTAWEDDDAIESVFLDGAGERGLCAGGDVLQLRDLALTEGDATRFLAAEYSLNAQIGEYPKPYLALQDGVTMGGGLGVSAHGSVRMATVRTRFAMPETMIGFFPDVGLRWQLSRAPGELGMWLALTGRSIDAAAGIAVGFADLQLDQPTADPGEMLAAREWADECFVGDDPREMLARLQHCDHKQATEAAAQLAARSPFAVWLTTLAMRAAAKATSLTQVLAQDLQLATAMTAHPDFVEGIGAKMIDKREPKWADASLEAVNTSEVTAIVGD